MRAWPAPPVPEVAGAGTGVRLFDTAARQVRPLDVGPTASLYVCGITPYDATHLGHATTYLAFDLLVRAWRDAGHDVRYVQNVTDVDDPLLERAAATGDDWRALAEREIARFRTDMQWLRVLPPGEYLGAVECIPRIAETVRGLLAGGSAYRVAGGDGEPDGDVYFAVEADPGFGEVAHLDRPTMLAVFAERGGDPGRAGKKDPLDALLWRVERPGEPSWDGGELGRGRPGWHVECTAIALEHLPQPFDVQGGGSDLAFPHHEMGASHGQVLTGRRPFARCYAHSGMVRLGGEKMSKSRGNLVFVSRLRAGGVDPMAVRLAVLAHHWRTDWDWTDGDLPAAGRRLARWRSAVTRPQGPDAAAAIAGVRERLADDLDAPGALGVVDRWVERQDAAGGADPAAPALLAAALDALLGVRLR